MTSKKGKPYRSCMIVGTMNLIGKKNRKWKHSKIGMFPEIQSIFDTDFEAFPRINNVELCNNIFSLAIPTFKTNFINSLIHPFDTRMKYHIQWWVREKIKESEISPKKKRDN